MVGMSTNAEARLGTPRNQLKLEPARGRQHIDASCPLITDEKRGKVTDSPMH